MLARLQRALLVILVCILPVQSMAAALVPLTCSPQETHHASGSQHEGHDHASHSHGGGAGQHDGTGPEQSNDGHGHLCCHQFSSAATSAPAPATPHDFRMYTASVSVLAPLHIPELPQRPPRS